MATRATGSLADHDQRIKQFVSQPLPISNRRENTSFLPDDPICPTALKVAKAS